MYSEASMRRSVRPTNRITPPRFEKNRDTQFYKRWMRNADCQRHCVAWVRRCARRSRYRLTESGRRWAHGYDPEVAMQFQVQSPGACHVYTVEQAASNHEVVWDRDGWGGKRRPRSELGTHDRDLPLTSVYSVAIHPLDPDRVYVGSGSGQLWRTTDGGLTWEECGNSTFQGADRWYRDVIFAPIVEGEEPQLFAATNYGLFRSENDGETRSACLR